MEKRLEIGRMLGGMMGKSDLFCNAFSNISEAPAKYLTETDDCSLLTAYCLLIT
ncbi:MAG: hypothetical protein Q7T89_11345 [Anaerolineales bacterium]|nr:hypothetical protein [Anaerolineales bacterium]